MIESPDCIFVAPVDFSGLQQRHQAFAGELAASGSRVVYVEPLKSPGFSISRRQVSERLCVASVSLPFRASSFPGLQRICAKLLLQLLSNCFKFRLDKTNLWLAEPSLAAIALPGWRRVVYDCCDLHGAFPGQRTQAWEKYEALLAQNADLICVSHQYLARRFFPEHAGKILSVPNACSQTFIELARHSAAAKSGRTTGENRLIKMVSSGAHYEWVDCAWLELLSGLVGVELHIAGTGRGEAFSRLINNGNTIFHGRLEHDELVKLLCECDVGLIPFRNIGLIEGVDPIKAYEYAACGLEIWAPDVTALRSRPLIARFVADRFQAEQALRDFRQRPLIFCGSIPTWAERLQTVLDRPGVLRAD